MDKITLSHGSGGRAMHDLIDGLFLKELDNSALREKKDSAILKIGSKKLAFTTDSYVVNPIIFPGGDIGSLAVHGTVNDLAVVGAKPLYISMGIIIEEGLDLRTLGHIVRSIKKASRISGVKVVTGDTKVVEKGSCDKLFINTSGIGEIYYEGLSVSGIKPGDSIIVNGPVGEHAISILSKREGIDFGSRIISDSAPLGDLINKVLNVSGKVRFMRDPTRGGIAATLNEIVKDMPFGISLFEKDIPVRKGTKDASELLGMDPLYLACEGRVIIIVAREDEEKVLKTMRERRDARLARTIGKIVKDHKGMVYLSTTAGGRRIVDMLSGEQLPRIC